MHIEKRSQNNFTQSLYDLHYDGKVYKNFSTRHAAEGYAVGNLMPITDVEKEIKDRGRFARTEAQLAQEFLRTLKIEERPFESSDEHPLPLDIEVVRGSKEK